ETALMPRLVSLLYPERGSNRRSRIGDDAPERVRRDGVVGGAAHGCRGRMESGDLSCAEPRRVAGQRFEIAVDAVERVDDAGLDRVPGTRDRLFVLDGQRLHARGERVL